MTQLEFTIEDGGIKFSKYKPNYSSYSKQIWIIDMGSTTGTLEVRGHRVVECSPFLKRYFEGKKIKETKELIEKKGWKLKNIIENIKDLADGWDGDESEMVEFKIEELEDLPLYDFVEEWKNKGE